ncbi:MAG: YfbM family protein [Bacteroidota bacterium]
MGIVAQLYRISSTQLMTFLADPVDLEKALAAGLLKDTLYLDKSWAGLHFLMCDQTFSESLSTADVRSSFFIPDQVIDEDQDFGTGPAFYLNPAQLDQINSQLKMLQMSELRERFDPERFNQRNVYPGRWAAEAWDYLVEYLQQLRRFYQTAYDQECAIIMING